MRERLPELPGRRLADYAVRFADDFSYTDPVDGSVSRGQGVRIGLANDARLVFRLSGTGTEGATLRVYLERYEPDASRHGQEPSQALAGLAQAAEQIGAIQARLGRGAPSLIT